MPNEHFTIDVDGRVHRLTISNCFVTDGAEYTAKIDKSKTSAKLVVEGKTSAKLVVEDKTSVKLVVEGKTSVKLVVEDKTSVKCRFEL